METNSKASDRPKPGAEIKVGRVELKLSGDEVIIRMIDRPAVCSKVSVAQLERWAIRQLREGVFA